MRNWRIVLFVAGSLLVSRLVAPAVAPAQSDDPLMRLYENNELFEQLSGAARSLLELKFGRKAGEAIPTPEIIPNAPAGPSSYVNNGDYVGNILVNDPNLDVTARDTQSETTLVLGSGGTVCSAYNDSGSFSGFFLPNDKFTGFSQSPDGGLTWTDKGTLPTNPNGDAGDPVLARSSLTGTTFFATLQFSGSGINVFRSTDDCGTFGTPVQGAPAKSGLQDKEWIAVDNFAGSGQGNVYLVERDFGPGNGIYFFRSTDDGLSFGPSGGTLIGSGVPVNVQGAFVTVGPDHAVYVFFFDQNSLPQRIRVRKSTDQGITFGPTADVANLGTTSVNGNLGLNGGFRTNAFPQAVANPTNGNIYVVFNDNPPDVDRADIFFTQSTDGGATWSAPVRVNDDATTNDQWQPALAVTPDGTRLFVGFYDRRLDPTNNLIDTFGAIGSISGATVAFGSNFRVTDQSFPVVRGQDPVVNSTYMGDYDQAVADNDFFYYTWGDNRLPNPNFPAHAHQPDVRFTKIPVQFQNVNALVAFNPIVESFRTTLDTTGCPASFAGKFSFDAKLTNITGSSLASLVTQVATLTGDNLLQNADGGPGGVGAKLTVPKKDDFSDGVLSSGEFVDVPFVICLNQIQPFDFFVDVLGTVDSGPVASVR